MRMLSTADEIVSFWRAAGQKRWFNKDTAFDEEIRKRFLDTYEAAAAGKFSDWDQNGQGALALLILFDRFPRNRFGGDPRTLATTPLPPVTPPRPTAPAFPTQFP